MSTAAPVNPEHLPTPPLNIETELKESYLTYAMSVIVSRALPDIRDGLKPSQRRILTAMLDLGLNPGGSTSKCAGIVGETMKRYHPHGDASIYPALARMAQWWNMRHMLITGQGNFGSIHGLPPAAMRYTEAKLSPIAAEMLEDIRLDTVDFQPSYDEKHQEPRVLPAKFPNLLVNGSGGIAVGMATSHPAAQPRRGLRRRRRPDRRPRDRPRRPDGARPRPRLPHRRDHLRSLGYPRSVPDRPRQGDPPGQVRDRGDEGRPVADHLHRDPLPAHQGTAPQKAGRARQRRPVNGVTDIVDESDRKQPVRIVVKVKKGEDPNVILNQLYQYSPLQDSFSVIMLALVDGRPEELPLKRMLRLFIDHRVNVIRRRTQFQLRQAKQRAHIVEGLLIALSYIDEIIRVIRSSANPVEARARLMGLEVSAQILQRALNNADAKAAAGLTRMQADAILSMRLQQLTGLEADKLVSEYNNLRDAIGNYERILGDERVVLDLIRADLREMKQKYADPRRSVIDPEELGDYDKEALIREEYMVVTVTHDGYIKRLPPSTYRNQNRGGRGISATNTKGDDFLEHMFVALTHDYILFFTDHGKVYWLKVYDIPEQTRTSGGRAIVNLLQMAEGEKITGLVPVRRFNEDESLFMVTRRGTVKKTSLTAFKRPLGRGIIALGLDEGDELIGVARTKENDHVVLSTKGGMAIRFDESRVRSMGRPAYGVRGIELEEGDEVIGMVVANGTDDPASLLTVCAHGFGKRTALTEYRPQNRGGKGLIDIKVTDRNGPVVAIAKVVDTDEVMLTTSGGILIRTAIADMRLIGRNTQGVRLIRVEEGASVGSLAKLPETELQVADEPVATDGEGVPPPATHILDDGVGEAEAGDHIDDMDGDGEPDAE